MVKLGDNPKSYVEVIEVGNQPAKKIDVKTPTTGAIVKYVEVIEGEIVDSKPSPQKPVNKIVDIIDAEIIESPEGKPKKSTASQHYGLKNSSFRSSRISSNLNAFSSSERASAQGQEIGNFIGGLLVGLYDAFKEEETDIITKRASDDAYLLKGGYFIGKEFGKNVKPWIEDRTRDIKTWTKDIFNPKPFPERDDEPKSEKLINWPDFFPPVSNIPFPKFEPNFNFEPEFDFTDYKKSKPEKKAEPQTKKKPHEKPFPPEDDSPNKDPIIDDEDDPSDIEFDLPPGEYNLSFTINRNWEMLVNQINPLPDGSGYSFKRTCYRGSDSSRISNIRVINLKALRLRKHPKYVGQRTGPSDWIESQKYFWTIDCSEAYQFGSKLSPITGYPNLKVLTYNRDYLEFSRAKGWEWIHWREWEQYPYFDNSTKSLTDIIPQPKPPTPPEKEPPKKVNKVTICLFDEEKIKRIIRSCKAKIEVPVVEAVKQDVNGVEKWIPKINRTQVEVLAVDEYTAASMALIYRKIAEIQIDLIKLRNQEPPIAAVPEWWQIRIGNDRPQSVILYAEKLANGKISPKSRWPLTIPHYNEAFKKPRLPSYEKGQWEGILTLKDNSKLIVNAKTQKEAERMLRQLGKFIKGDMMLGATSKVGLRKGKKLKECKVIPVSISFFSQGQENTNPDWYAKLV